MKCEEARRFLGPYLDSELDPKTSFEIARHVEVCTGCRERFEAEGRLERAIAEELRVPAPNDDEIWNRALAASAPRNRIPIVLVTAAILFIVLGISWIVFPGEAGLADDLRSDHRKVQAGRSPLDVTTSNPDEVSEFFRKHLGIEVSTGEVPDGRLMGGRRCALRGVPAAFLLYRVDGEPISVCVFPADRLGSFKNTLETPLMDEGSEIKVAAYRSGGQVVGASGRLACDRLLAICRSFAR